MFVHPMNADNVDKAASYELQAIGRVLQARDAVHVWKFVTIGTVESDIFFQNKNAIEARERSKKELADKNANAGAGAGTHNANSAGF